LQESVRFNKLLSFIEKTLKELLQATRGEALMSDMLEKINQSLTLNQVPKEWEKRAYPSMKPLASWF
jgi:dynein heavy chain